jgi:hypothetical protein
MLHHSEAYLDITTNNRPWFRLSDLTITIFGVLLSDLACKEVSLLQIWRRDKLHSLFSFGVGKVGDNGRVPIPESHSKEETEQGEDSAEEAGKPKRRPGRPVKDCHCRTTHTVEGPTHPFSKS